MTALRYSAAMSLDGFVAGPDQSREHPLGVGGDRLHGWMRALAAWRRDAGLDGGVENASTAVYEAGGENIGASSWGRNMFGGGPGPWGDSPWDGWWGDEPPFGMPAFVLTTIRGRGSSAAAGRRSRSSPRARRPPSARPGRRGRARRRRLRRRRRREAADRGRLFEGDGIAELGPEQVRATDAPGVTHMFYRTTNA